MFVYDFDVINYGFCHALIKAPSVTTNMTNHWVKPVHSFFDDKR